MSSHTCMIVQPISSKHIYCGLFSTETALGATLKELKVTKATLHLAKDMAKDVKKKFVEKKLYENCVTVLLPLVSSVFTAVLVIIGAGICLLVYAIVWLILELVAYFAKIGYHTVSILIESLQMDKTDFAKGEEGDGNSKQPCYMP